VKRRTGRNIVIDSGAGVVSAGANPDQLFLRGPTAFDADVASLRAILAEWARPNLTRRERLAHLTGETPGGSNGAAIVPKAAIVSPSR
jgi:hypothetical protein